MNFKSLKPPHFGSVLIETGLSAAIARGEPLSERMEATIFWVSAASGIAFIAGADLIALLFSRFVPGHDVLPSLLALSPVLLASALLTLPNGLVIRQQKFWAFAIADICAVIMSSTAAIILAFRGYGIRALVIQIQILTNTKLVVLYLCARPNISFKFHVSEIGWMLKFGFHAVLSNISTFISRTIDNMLIGGLLGTLKLGWYAMAFQIRTIPDSIISGPVYASLIPVIGRNSSDSNAVRKLFLSAISTISVIIFPISVGMSLTADFSIPLILGEKWSPSVKLLEILAVASGANCLAMAVGVCLLAIGHSRAQMALTGYLTAASVVAVPLGLPWGPPGVAVAILIASLSAWPFYLYTAKQKFGTSVIEILSRGRIPAIAIMPWRSQLLSAEKLLLSGWID